MVGMRMMGRGGGISLVGRVEGLGRDGVSVWGRVIVLSGKRRLFLEECAIPCVHCSSFLVFRGEQRGAWQTLLAPDKSEPERLLLREDKYE